MVSAWFILWITLRSYARLLMSYVPSARLTGSQWLLLARLAQQTSETSYEQKRLLPT